MAHFIARSAGRVTAVGARSNLQGASFLGGQAVGEQVRRLNLHEYQSKNLMDKFNVRTQRGQEASTPEEAFAVAEGIKKSNPDAELILKAQVHAGGRGKGHFKENGMKGGVQILTEPEEVKDFTGKMLGNTLVTKQTGDAGQPCNMVLVNEGLSITSEKYFAILMDRAFNGPVMVASSEGGMDIEEVAETNPDAIVNEAIDIKLGVQPEQTERLAKALGFAPENMADAQEQMSNLYDLMIASDATQVEINPFAEAHYAGGESQVFCVDAKLGFDDNAEYRQKDIYAQRDTSMEDERDVRADEVGVEYIGLDGNIGCMVNGAGLAMATMDIIKLNGGEPANFCDLGGGVNEKQVADAFEIVNSDSNVKALLINIFGGIVRCDTVATGIVNAYKNVGLSIPLIVRLEGTNSDIAKAIIDEAAIPGLVSAVDLDDAAAKAVAAI
jgi:succinyl-CoA synthetase beta subunit|eukprot:g2073.t1